MNEYIPVAIEKDWDMEKQMIDREDGLISGGTHGVGAVINKGYDV